MNANIECVYVHGFRIHADGSEYCDPDENPDGWCAFERTPTDEGGTFDHGEEMDFPTLDAAVAWAEARAALHGCPILLY